MQFSLLVCFYCVLLTRHGKDVGFFLAVVSLVGPSICYLLQNAVQFTRVLLLCAFDKTWKGCWVLSRSGEFNGMAPLMMINVTYTATSPLCSVF
jgi:hypothetical protein